MCGNTRLHFLDIPHIDCQQHFFSLICLNKSDLFSSKSHEIIYLNKRGLIVLMLNDQWK